MRSFEGSKAFIKRQENSNKGIFLSLDISICSTDRIVNPNEFPKAFWFSFQTPMRFPELIFIRPLRFLPGYQFAHPIFEFGYFFIQGDHPKDGCGLDH